MSRLGTLTFCALVGLLACAFAQVPSSAPAQTDELKKAQQRIAELEKENALDKAPPSAARAIMAFLKQSVETKGLNEKVKLRTALEYFSQKTGGQLHFVVDQETFAAELGADAPDPYEEEVSLPPVPPKMMMGSALRLVLSQVGKGQADFIMRNGVIEIVAGKYASSAYFLYNTNVISSFERQPLPSVLQDLAEETGATIHLDPNINKRNDVLLSAIFRNCSLEDALVIVTEMAQLKYVVLDRSIFVTTRENARIIEKEEAARSKRRMTNKRVGRRLEAAAE